jgi:glycosyltransferase involved in cell wall biosynthesis
VLEAMAAARPVVGTPLGVEQVGFRDGEHGIVASQPADLARGAVALLANPDRSEALGRAARSHAERFRWNTVTAPAEALYDEWLSAAK